MNEQREYPFEFSVVMAVYNVEPFLREAVDSLIAQDFGFKKIQLIMVDDGSTDGSGAVCDEYAAKYPNNVIVLHKNNEGLAKARVDGIALAAGKYISFFDPDDILSADAIKNVVDFFEERYDEIDVVAIPIYFFGDQQGSHPLNNKFEKGTRIINLFEEFTCVQLSLASSVIKSEVAHLIEADSEIVTAEDAKELVKILLLKNRLGVVTQAQYNYRKRSGSSLGGARVKKGWYTTCLRNFSRFVIEYSQEVLGFVPRYVQYMVMYDLQGKIRMGDFPDGVLNEKEKEEFFEVLDSVFKQIDDQIIMCQKHIGPEYKYYVLKKKHGALPEQRPGRNDVLLCFQDTEAFSLSLCPLFLEFMEFKNGSYFLEGHSRLFPKLFDDAEIWVEVNGQAFQCELFKRQDDKRALGESILRYQGFRAAFPLPEGDGGCEVKFYIAANGLRAEAQNLCSGQFFPVSVGYEHSCYEKDGWKAAATERSLLISRCGRGEKKKNEFAFLRELWKKNDLGGRKAVFARIAYHVLKPFKRRPIWLISDRLVKADDNGEAFFRFVRSQHKRDVNAYFVLSKDSGDFARLRSVGKTVDALSFRHKLLHLLCDCNISAHADDITVIPFQGYHDSYRDILADVRFVFLQHGIIGNDLSGWLNRFNKDIAGFVTTAIPEYNSIIEGAYFYTAKEVWLTGLPRFDRLYDAGEKRVTIMPTWRRYLTEGYSLKDGAWRLGSDFINSDFFRFYNALLNDTRLHEAAERYGYQIQFMPHPNLQPHLSLFRQNDAVRYLGLDTSYRDIYAQSALVVTDYSSAVFDFAYLRKPLVYCQFDAEEFFKGEHVCTKGYFDYERDGFGEVERDLESTVDRVIEYMENGCQLKDKYRERIDRFFAFNDQNNCRRVYEKIMEMAKGEK